MGDDDMTSLGDILNAVRSWIVANRPVAGNGVSVTPTPQGRIVALSGADSSLMSGMTLVKLTAIEGVDGYCTGDVYGDGHLRPATTTGQKVKLIDWKLDPATPPDHFLLGYPEQVDIGGTLTAAWMVPAGGLTDDAFRIVTDMVYNGSTGEFRFTYRDAVLVAGRIITVGVDTEVVVFTTAGCP